MCNRFGVSSAAINTVLYLLVLLTTVMILAALLFLLCFANKCTTIAKLHFRIDKFLYAQRNELSSPLVWIIDQVLMAEHVVIFERRTNLGRAKARGLSKKKKKTKQKTKQKQKQKQKQK